MSVVGVLLAAGAGTRFGGGKLLAEISGVPMAVVAYRNLCAAVDSVIAVVRAGDEDLRQALTAAGATVTVCANAHEGMAASLACGVRAAPSDAGYVVALGDMPFIDPASIRCVAQSVRDGALIAAPVYRGERGHPVGFAAALRDELLRCEGDAGARAVLRAHAAALQLLHVEDAGVLRDIDTRAQLQQPHATSEPGEHAYKS